MLAETLLYNKSTLAESNSCWLKRKLYTKNIIFKSPTWLMMLDHWKMLLWKFINAMRIFVFSFDLPDGLSSSSFLGDMGVLTRNHNGNYSLESWLLLVINLESWMRCEVRNLGASFRKYLFQKVILRYKHQNDWLYTRLNKSLVKKPSSVTQVKIIHRVTNIYQWCGLKVCLYFIYYAFAYSFSI